MIRSMRRGETRAFRAIADEKPQSAGNRGFMAGSCSFKDIFYDITAGVIAYSGSSSKK